MMNVDVFLVEDDEFLQRSLSRVLGAAGYTVHSFLQAEPMLEALAARTGAGPRACVLLDVNLPGIDGVAAQKLIRQLDAQMPVVFMSAHPDALWVNQVWKDGARDVLFKPLTPKELLAALTEALSEPERKSPARAGSFDPHQEALVSSLTLRQRQVLVLLTRGMTHEQIAARIAITARTVKLHRSALMRRLGCKNLTELVRIHDACQHLLADTNFDARS